VSAGEPFPDGALDAVLLELADLQEKIARLEVAHADDQSRIADLTVTLQRVTGQRRGKKGAEEEGEGYKPGPAPRWWQLDGAERAAEIARLRAWVETVFRPGYGHLAAKVGPCWEQHDLCLYELSWLHELHTVVFLSPDRLLSSEADWHTRLLPSAVSDMAAETGQCDHITGGASRPGGDRTGSS
jgi:hypothetical protein